jgi:integrase/recombinase XerD
VNQSVGTALADTPPEFSWAVEPLQYWCAEGRELFNTANRFPALWPSERGGTLI